MTKTLVIMAKTPTIMTKPCHYDKNRTPCDNFCHFQISHVQECKTLMHTWLGVQGVLVYNFCHLYMHRCTVFN